MGMMERFLKPVIIGIAGLVFVLLVFSVVLPGEVMTSKWMKVASEKEKVIDVVADLSTWDDWNGLLQGAADIKITDSTLSWSSPDGRSNQVKIQGIEPNGVSTPISLGDDRIIRSGFSVEKREKDSVQVVWFIIEDLNWYPWEKFYGIMAEKMKGPLMQKSLDDLKIYIEAK